MRFKIEDDGIHLFLSEREVQKYGLLDENVIQDQGMPFKMIDGNHAIEINGRRLKFESIASETDKGFLVEMSAYGHKFHVEKINEINKYDCYRMLIREYQYIVT